MKCDRNLLARYCAEFTGTAMLMCIGCMGCIASSAYPRDLLEIAISFGIVVMIAVHCFGTISGAHVNPAVTLANCILGLMPWQHALAYFFLQMFGALFGFSLLAFIISKDDLNAGNGLCTTVPTGSITYGQAIGIEFLVTSILILFCCSVWDERNAGLFDSVSIKFGLLICGMAISGGHFTGASMNIARTFAPAVWGGQYSTLWIYFVAHTIAGILMPLLWMFVLAPNSKDSSGGGEA